MNATEWAAWIGAVTGCLALGLELLRWVRSGPRLSITSNPNMIPTQPTRDFPAEPHLFVWVQNVGDAKTTITAFELAYYSHPLLRLFRRGGEPAPVVKHVDPIPRRLAPGEEWTTLVKRGSVVEKARTRGCLYCLVSHTLSRRPVSHRVRFQ
ncbi:MAG TPA: hypothetical protein VFS23_07450 [Vicinamibacterales bacterium]|nr:hypothetical protein [Vicinamibacterales bacterium]